MSDRLREPEARQDEMTALLAGVVGRHGDVTGLDVAGAPRYAGSNRIRSRGPVALATFSSVRVDGGIRPLSIRAIADCVVFIRAASSACVNPALRRASMSARATSNSHLDLPTALPYIMAVHTVIWTPTFLRQARRLRLTQEEMAS